ncbi:MAG: HsdR family type I site-specific deoxyribonuclease [Bacteroidetes bacterium]|nr:HsdR family type I site-specific deoxyribonuclease [Bacteroidota bacterium]
MTEQQYVVDSLLAHLATMPDYPWTVIRLKNTQSPAETGRESFGEVVLPTELRAAVERLNPWLETDQVDHALATILSPPHGSLLEVNQHITQLLRNGYPDTNRFAGPHRTGETDTVRYVDLDDPAANRYVAVEEFKIRVLGTNDKHIRPDVVLFVNGLPWVVIECKAPKNTGEEIAEAIDQLMRYGNQRGFADDGNPALFWYNLCLVATCRTVAKFGTITTRSENHFYRWTHPYPFQLDDLPHGASTPNSQDRLVRGMFYAPTLLDLLRSFSVFSEDEGSGKTLKVVARYQQYRAVKKTVDKLRAGQTSRERGGIIWHTQGSGKSLTMLFLIREMYRHADLMRYKVVLLTDRKQLDDQIRETARSLGYALQAPGSIADLKATLRNTNSEIVSVMIHKFQEREYNTVFPELNASPDILVLIDEAHRTQYSLLGSNLSKALPQATKVVFTGTPIEKTKRAFGAYIDYYTMRQAIEDEVTLGILYEGRTHNAEIPDQSGMDAKFADIFSDYNIQERLQILGYATRQAYMEAESTIAAKAEDMLRHYVTRIFPDGYKAQIVTISKEAAHRYRLAIERILPRLVDEYTENANQSVDLEQLRKVEAKVVLSSAHNDPPYLAAYGNSSDHRQHIKRFRTPYGESDESTGGMLDGNVGILIVVDMLLTGFDAPIEQVMYLDRPIRGHNLLQAIARVNRVGGEFKKKGFLVDYVGVGHHLKDALDVYDAEEHADVAEVLERSPQVLQDLMNLRDEIRALFTAQGVVDLRDRDAIFDALYDEDVRGQFVALFRRFNELMDQLYPRAEALDFLSDLLRFCEVSVLAGQHFREHRLSMKGVSPKLRSITDAYLASQGIEQSIEPVSIFDEDFANQVGQRGRTRTRAAAIEHAVRHHIDIHFDDDPALYASLAEALQNLLQEFRDNWEEIYRRLQELLRQIRQTEQEPTYGLHRRLQMPFFRAIRSALFEQETPTEEQIVLMVELTRVGQGLLTEEIRLTGFWENIPAQNHVKGELTKIIVSPEYKALPAIFAKRNAIITRLMEIAKTNHEKLIQPLGGSTER